MTGKKRMFDAISNNGGTQRRIMQTASEQSLAAVIDKIAVEAQRILLHMQTHCANTKPVRGCAYCNQGGVNTQ